MTLIQLPCGHQISEAKLLSLAGKIASARRTTPTGGLMPGGEKGRPRGTAPRCACGMMTAKRAAARAHKCG